MASQARAEPHRKKMEIVQRTIFFLRDNPEEF
jgi:hypothetical protein